MKKGFTLIELLVVVLIVGILSAIALPKYQVAVMKARYTQAMTLVNSIYQAQQVYYMANGYFADNYEELDIEIPDGKINDDGKQVNYSWGYCRLQKGGKSSLGIDEVYCGMKGNISLIYLRGLSTGNEYCRYHPSNDTNKMGEKVCKTFGGIKTTGDEFIQYKLN